MDPQTTRVLLEELRAKCAAMGDTVADIHRAAVAAVEDNCRNPWDAGDGVIGKWHARHAENMARLAAVSAIALAKIAELDGPSSMQSGTHTYGRERVAK